MNELRKWMRLTEQADDLTPADRFISTAADWINKSVAQHGVHTPAMDELDSDRVAMGPLNIPESRKKVVLSVMSHLGKLADMLGVTLVAIGVPSAEQWLYDDFQPEYGALFRYPRR